MLTWKVIGCASGMPVPHLAHSSYLLKMGAHQVLFDIGEGVSSALQRCKVDPLQIGTILVSHMHPDHCIGLPLFIQMNQLMKRKERLDIFLPGEAVTIVSKLLDACYLFPEKLLFEIEIHRISRSLILEMTGLLIEPISNTHLTHQKVHLTGRRFANKLESYSFLIKSNGKKILYSGDISGIADIAAHLACCDLLIVDSMHTDLTELGRIGGEQRLGQVILTHLPEAFDFVSIRKRLIASGIKKVHIAREGFEISI